jgi:hypothetical protein
MGKMRASQGYFLDLTSEEVACSGGMLLAPNIKNSDETKSMNGNLSHQLIDEYFDNHLPYRTRILLAHYKMRHTATGAFVPWTGNQAWLDSCFVASLVTARLYLNMFGIGKNRDGTALVNYKGRDTDMTVEKLGGDRVDFTQMSVADQKMLLAFIIMADQAAAHFTTPIPHDRGPIPKVIKLIHGYLKTHLYEVVGRAGLETMEEGCFPKD